MKNSPVFSTFTCVIWSHYEQSFLFWEVVQCVVKNNNGLNAFLKTWDRWSEINSKWSLHTYWFHSQKGDQIFTLFTCCFPTSHLLDANLCMIRLFTSATHTWSCFFISPQKHFHSRWDRWENVSWMSPGEVDSRMRLRARRKADG